MRGEESFETKPFDSEQVNSILEAGQLDSQLAKYKRRLLVYLSGKYRDKDEHSVDCNIHYAKRVAVELWKMGFAVICPQSNSDHMGFDGDGGCFLEGDMVMVERSDLVVMLDNWETSEGSKLERRLALRLGIPVYYWGVHQLSLQRLTSDDHRYRGARAAIIGRADRLAFITGYQPDEVHISPVTSEGNCSTCGNPWDKGKFARKPRSLAERLQEDFIQNTKNTQTSHPEFRKQV